MRKILKKTISVFLVLSLLAVSASAASLRSSLLLSNCSVTASAETDGAIDFVCYAHGTNTMDTIGFSSAVIQKYSGGSWISARNVSGEYESDSDYFATSIHFIGAAGMKYRIVVTFYAANGSTSSKRTLTSDAVYATD